MTQSGDVSNILYSLSSKKARLLHRIINSMGVVDSRHSLLLELMVLLEVIITFSSRNDEMTNIIIERSISSGTRARAYLDSRDLTELEKSLNLSVETESPVQQSLC